MPCSGSDWRSHHPTTRTGCGATTTRVPIRWPSRPSSGAPTPSPCPLTLSKPRSRATRRAILGSETDLSQQLLVLLLHGHIQDQLRGNPAVAVLLDHLLQPRRRLHVF